MRKEGAASPSSSGLHDLHPEIHRLMGRLKYRTSYGQNVLAHSAEVARPRRHHGAEVGLDAHVAVRAAFVHDIGKAIDREMEGTHLQIGIDFLRKHGESEAVVMAMAAHHMDIDWPSLEAMIVQAADAISAARPGARRDILESYVKRLEKLEGIADSFKGVSKSFALQAGREIRIMVESEKVSDEEAIWLSKDIARRIENELEYPGQIKVTVIRETRATDYANDAGWGLGTGTDPAQAPSPKPQASTVADCSERELIARVRTHLPPTAPWVLVGIGDDAAVVEPERNRVDVLTVDANRRRRAFRSCVHAAGRDRPPRACGQPQRSRGDGRAPRLGCSRWRCHRPCPSLIRWLVGGFAAACRAFSRSGRRRQPDAERHGPLTIDVHGDWHGQRRPGPDAAPVARPGDDLYVSGSLGRLAPGPHASSVVSRQGSVSV
jgi:putative nucleotidyltransferase with HDIG domain